MQSKIYKSNAAIYESYASSFYFICHLGKRIKFILNYFFNLGDYEQGKLVKAVDTCKKLMSIIQNNTFENGSSIDYFD